MQPSPSPPMQPSPSPPVAPCTCYFEWRSPTCDDPVAWQHGCQQCGLPHTWCIVDVLPCLGTHNIGAPLRVLTNDDAWSYDWNEDGWSYCNATSSPPPPPPTPGSLDLWLVVKVALASMGGVLLFVLAARKVVAILRRTEQLLREKDRLAIEQRMLSHSLSQLQVHLDPGEPLHIEMLGACRGAHTGSYAPSNEGGGAPVNEGGGAGPSQNRGLCDMPSVRPLLSARALVSPLLSTSHQLERETSRPSMASTSTSTELCELSTSTGAPQLHSGLSARQRLMAQSATEFERHRARSASLDSASSSDNAIPVARATTYQARHCSLQSTSGRASRFASWSSSAGSEASAEVPAINAGSISGSISPASSYGASDGPSSDGASDGPELSPQMLQRLSSIMSGMGLGGHGASTGHASGQPGPPAHAAHTQPLAPLVRPPRQTSAAQAAQPPPPHAPSRLDDALSALRPAGVRMSHLAHLSAADEATASGLAARLRRQWARGSRSSCGASSTASGESYGSCAEVQDILDIRAPR